MLVRGPLEDEGPDWPAPAGAWWSGEAAPFVKGWLPAAGVKKIKFVSKSNIGEFVREEDRLKEENGDEE